jgi:hypothetical protein
VNECGQVAYHGDVLAVTIKANASKLRKPSDWGQRELSAGSTKRQKFHVIWKES